MEVRSRWLRWCGWPWRLACADAFPVDVTCGQVGRRGGYSVVAAAVARLLQRKAPHTLSVRRRSGWYLSRVRMIAELDAGSCSVFQRVSDVVAESSGDLSF